MDAILELADDLLLDRLYAYLLPAPSTSTHPFPTFLHSLASSVHHSLAPSPSTTPSPISLLSSETSTSTSTLSPSSLTPLSHSAWPRDCLPRLLLSLFSLTWAASFIMYFLFATGSYYLIFDRRLEYHPKFARGQKWREVKMSLTAMPTISAMTLPWFIGEVRGRSMLYDRVDEYGWAWLVMSAVLYMVWNDVTIYWIHRAVHHKSLYKYIHKRGYYTSSASFEMVSRDWRLTYSASRLACTHSICLARLPPYRRLPSKSPLPVCLPPAKCRAPISVVADSSSIFVYICPLQKHLYIGLFIFVQLWTIIIHVSLLLPALFA